MTGYEVPGLYEYSRSEKCCFAGIRDVREGILLGYGNPLLDMSVNGDDAFLKKYDLRPNDVILAAEKHLPMYEEMVERFSNVEYVPGGSTQNTLRVAQWLLKFDKMCTFFGCISKDNFGRILEQKARENGVNVQYQYTTKAPTGTCAVLINGKERSLCANLAAANLFTEDHIVAPENWALVEKAQYFYIASFSLSVCPSGVMHIAKHACQQSKVFCSNLSAPFICQFFKDPLLETLPYVDYLFGNENEAVEFGKINNFETDDLKQIALKSAALPKKNQKRSRTVVFTREEKSTIVAHDGQVKEYPVVVVNPEEIVDTNAAGDAFVGGFLAQLIHEKPLEECIRCAHYAASVIIKQSGCTFPEKSNFQ